MSLERAEKIYSDLKKYNTDHRRWLKILESLETGLRPAYDTAQEDEKLALLESQSRALRGKLVKEMANVRKLEQMMPTDQQIASQREFLAELTRQHDEKAAGLASVVEKHKQLELLTKVDEQLSKRVEAIRQLEPLELRSEPVAQGDGGVYRGLVESLDEKIKEF